MIKTSGVRVSKVICQSSDDNIKCVKLGDCDLIKVKDTSTVALVKVKEVDTISNIYYVCRNEGFDDINIHYIGGLWVWIQFTYEKTCETFKANDSLKKLWSSIMNVSPAFKVDERMVWIEIIGLPLCAWGSNAFKKVASLFGKFKFFDLEVEDCMSMGRSCIATKVATPISEKVNVSIHGENFQVCVKEIGTWSIHISNDLESINSDEGGDANKCRSFKDNVDPIEDLDDFIHQNVEDKALKNPSHASQSEGCTLTDFEKEHVINDDDDVALPREQKEGDTLVDQVMDKHTVIQDDKIPNEVTSDYSKPPGFKNYFKKNNECSHSSITSRARKCSTSFANYSRKELKGFSFIDEMNRMIEVGGALGYDVKGGKKSLRQMINSIETKMTKLELFQLRSIWGNFNFDYACSMARGMSGGLITMWDPNVFAKKRIWCGDNYIIVEGKRKNSLEDYLIINVYGPQYQPDKAILWSTLRTFIQNNNGRVILFGDLNEVRCESERFGSIFSSSDATIFNSFIRSTGLIDLPMGGRKFTWVNKVGSKMSKLDRFLISNDTLQSFPDLQVVALDRLWSDHNLILLHCKRKDFDPTTFKLFHSWFYRIDFEDTVKEKWAAISSGLSKPLHIKLKDLKTHLKLWYSHTKEMQELDNFEKLESMDLVQKSRVKWEVEGDENTNFFHGLINSRRKSQMVQGIMLDGVWIFDPKAIKDAFLDFYKDKFSCHDSPVSFPSILPANQLSSHDRDSLKVMVSLEEIKTAVWDCGSQKAPGPDGYSFMFIKKFWELLKHDIHMFVVNFFCTGKLPQGSNSDFIMLILKVPDPLFIKDYRPISLIGLHYKIVAKILANRLSKVIDSIISPEQSAFISGRQILDGPLILSEIIDWYKKRKKKLMLFKVGLVSTRTSILVNGGPTSKFSLKRGLRQGDPLSPFLFIIVMEGLHMTLRDAVAANMFQGVKGGSDDSRKLAWVKWSNILASLDKGGLGIGSLKAFNLSLLLKWRWRPFQNPDVLWVRVVKAIHGEEAGFDIRGCQTNRVWASIVSLIYHLHSSGIVPLHSIRFKVGDGSSIRFWKDTWLGDDPLYIRYNKLLHLENNKDCSIRHRIVNGTWAWDWNRPVNVGRTKAEFDALILDIANLDTDEIGDSDSCI
ncbi:RNA-directed DNA polymerase, eukaryota, reverse transcriptase zinc-binding domain protein [Tanacetum coccineum]